MHWRELGEVKNKCTSYNFRLLAIFVPKKYQIWWKFDVVITKIILLVFSETRYKSSKLNYCWGNVDDANKYFIFIVYDETYSRNDVLYIYKPR